MPCLELLAQHKQIMATFIDAMEAPEMPSSDAFINKGEVAMPPQGTSATIAS